jgi:hypothetical protein
MSLPIAIRQILDKIGSQDSFFGTETPDVTLPGPSTPESVALEGSIHSLIARFQRLERKTIQSEPITKQLEGIKMKEEVEKHVCLCCGYRLDGVPLTPEEAPCVDMSSPKSSFFVLKRALITSFGI